MVKIFSEDVTGRARERFQREGELHRTLEHKAILELLDADTDDGTDYIVTRLLEPGALRDLIVDENSRLVPSRALKIGERIADALAYMHSREEVHGDISPGNILLEGETDAYLVDFGLSKKMVRPVEVSSGEEIRTKGYAPPRDSGTPRTYKDDVYGLAAVLWFCLTAEPPPRSRRARRRAIPNRALRAPLSRALNWDSKSFPTAKAFKQSLIEQWPKAVLDWRVVSSKPSPHRLPAAVAVALIVLCLAWLAGQALQPKPAAAAQTTIDRHGVSLSLAGKWKSQKPPSLPAFHLQSPIAAAGSRALVVVGRAPSAGPQLISARARASLPPAARRPHSVLIGERAALRFRSATGAVFTEEVLALPLAHDVLVVRCSGLASALSRMCAQVAADLELDDGSMQPLAPTPSVVRQLRAATGELRNRRSKQRSLLASTTTRHGLSVAAKDLASADRAFAGRIAALPTTAQDGKSIDAVVEAARAAASAYDDLALATTNSAWQVAQVRVDRRERHLASATHRLGGLRTYGNSS